MNLDICPITGSKERIEYLNLGNTPLVNNLCETREESLLTKKYPLAVQLFTESRLSCLTYIVDPEKLFSTYFYQSGINKPYLDHCAEMYDYLKKYVDYSYPDNFLMADIGGDDGSLLKVFQEKNNENSIRIDYVNVDASMSFREVNEQAGITYMNEFFNENTRLPRPAKLITSTNVLQHGVNVRSFIKGINNNLSNQGLWCLEFPYYLSTILSDNYDQIYHEHIYYYLLQNIKDMVEQEGMKIINVSFYDIHAGSLRVLTTKRGNPIQPHSSVQSFINLEKNLTDEYYMLWGERTHLKINKFTRFIDDLNKEGARIACFGASAKGCVFLNTCGLDYKKIMFVIDDTPYKQGKFVPGTGLEIVSREVLKTEKIDYLIITAHNFKDYIIKSLKNQYFGVYIIMFPDISII